MAPQPAAADTSADGVTAETRARFDVLPLRSVRELAALAPGVRRDLATGVLTVRSRSGVQRGALGREPVFLVDGVRQLGGPVLPFEIVEQVRVVTEGVPASLGQAAGGLVAVNTEDGARALGGRLEAFSSRATDAYDRDLGALSVRGPLGTVGGFSLAAEIGRAGDARPIGGPGALVPSDEALDMLVEAPQLIQVTENGTTRLLPFPGDAVRSAFLAGQRFTDDDLRARLGLSPQAQIGGLVSGLNADGLERQRARDAGLDDLRLAGALDLTPLGQRLRVKVGGRLDRQSLDDASSPSLQTRLRFSPGSGYQSRETGQALWLRVEHALTSAVGYRLSASTEGRDFTIYPRGFTDDVADALGYGDLDAPDAVVRRRYAQRVFGGFDPLIRGDSETAFVEDGAGLFALPGSQVGRYRRRQSATAQLAGAVTLNVAGARLEIGGDAERETYREFALNGFALAQYAADGTNVRPVGGLPPGGARAYDELPYQALRPYIDYYGFAFDGLSETGGAPLDDLFTVRDGVPVSSDIAPFQPTTVAGWAEGTGEIGPLAVRVGLRVETYNRGGETLFDAFANRPVVRAGSLRQRPETIGEDFAVYFAGGAVGDQNVVGFRDLDGGLFDARGQSIGETGLEALNGFQALDFDQPASAAFVSSPSHTSFQPRVRFGLRVSPGLALSATYDRLSRRPPPELYSTALDYVEATSSARLVSPDLRPETVDALRLGADAALSPRLAVSAAVFHRRSDDEIVLRRATAGLTRYSLYANAGQTRETGADLGVAWTPSDALSATASYTLAVAEASDADPITLGVLAFRGGDVPTDLRAPAPDGARHEIDATLTARLPARFGGLNLGLALSAQSGLPYTALDSTGVRFRVGESFTANSDGSLNSTRLPWTSQLDLRIGRQFRVGGAGVEVFGWVENLLGTDNVLAVYRATRRADSDGYRESARGYLSTEASQRLYQAYVDGPANVGGAQSTSNPFFYGQPRQIRIGVRATL